MANTTNDGRNRVGGGAKERLEIGRVAYIGVAIEVCVVTVDRLTPRLWLVSKSSRRNERTHSTSGGSSNASGGDGQKASGDGSEGSGGITTSRSKSMDRRQGDSQKGDEAD